MKNTENKDVKPNKNKGAADIYLFAIMFMLLVIIIVFSSFRTIMLSEVIYTIDDAVVASALGAITPNNIVVENAFGVTTPNNTDTGQLLITTDDNTEAVDKNVRKIKKGEYTPAEKAIIESESVTDATNLIWELENAKTNNDEALTSILETEIAKKSQYSSSSVFVTGAGEKFKKAVGYDNTKTNSRTPKPTDTQMYTLLSRVGSLISNNLSNSTATKQPEIIDTFDTTKVGNALKIKNSDLKTNSFVGDYLASDIDITRLEAYSVYKYTLAKRHIYASPWFEYEVKVNGVWKGPYTWDGENILDSDEIAKSSSPEIELSIKKDGTITKTKAIKDMVNTTDKNCNGIEIKISGFIKDPNSNAPALNKMKEVESRDKDAFENRATTPLIFFEDTGITCQTSWYDYTVEGKHYTNELNKEYGFLWNNDSHSAILINKNSLTEVNDNTPYKDKTKVYTKPDDYTIGTGKIPVIPIEGYASYIYVKGNSGAIKRKYNSFSSTATNTVDTPKTCISTGIANKDVRITFGDYDNNGTLDDEASADEYKEPFGYKEASSRPKLFNTSLYVEAKYKVKTFITGTMFNIGPYNTKDARVSKLVSITKGENPE